MTAPSMMPKKDETLFQYWASFSPFAPWVGVEWRFAPMFRTDKDAGETAKKAARKAVKSASNVSREASKLASDGAAKSAERAGKAATKAVENATLATVMATKAAADRAAEASESFGKAAEDAVELMSAPGGLFSAPPAKADDLKKIKGIGPKIEGELNALGVYTFEQISKFTEANLAWADANLSTIKAAPWRENWTEQAKALMGK